MCKLYILRLHDSTNLIILSCINLYNFSDRNLSYAIRNCVSVKRITSGYALVQEVVH